MPESIKYKVVSNDGKVMCKSGSSYVPSWIDETSPISSTYVAAFKTQEDAQKYLDKVGAFEHDERNRFVGKRLKANIAKSSIVAFEITRG